MKWQMAQLKTIAETGLRLVQNSNPLSGALTAGSIAYGTPVVLESNTASLPSTTTNTACQNYINKPATVTSITNNLFAGILIKGPRTDYLEREALGLVQCYGPTTAVWLRQTAGASVGNLGVPNSDSTLVTVTGPVTAGTASTATHTEVPAIGGLVVLMEALATSSATETTIARGFVRAM